MTPIPFALPSGRILPPTTAYAAGLICELRPDLADGVRSAVLGDRTVDALNDLADFVFYAGGEGGADIHAASICMSLLGVIWDIGNGLHGLADVLGMIPHLHPRMAWFHTWQPRLPSTPFSQSYPDAPGRGRDRSLTIGERWIAQVDQGYPTAQFGQYIVGFGTTKEPDDFGNGGSPDQHHRAHDAAELLLSCLRDGFAAVWGKASTPGEHEALRRLIPLHAHTVSLDAKVRAAWAKAHLDALAEPVRPMSPDRLN